MLFRSEGEDKAATGEGSTGEEQTPSSGTDENATTGGAAGENGSKSNSSSKPGKGNAMPSPRTNAAMEQAMKSLNDTSAKAWDVVRSRLPESRDAVVPFTQVLADFEAAMQRGYGNKDFVPFRNADYTAASGAMATAFDRRKAADTWKRTTIAKTGSIDPLRMTQYRWNDDIFRRTARVTTGKNHGIVILLDWSGSMNPIMQATLGQLIILTDFCRTAGVPFEVFAFTDSVYTNIGGDEWSESAFKQRDAITKTFTEIGRAHV